jgi:hypothetical protein
LCTKTFQWLSGFDPHGGVWNRARAMDAMARSATAVPARGKKRAGGGKKRACPEDGGMGQKRACPARAAV